jgi:hypothetical protein
VTTREDYEPLLVDLYQAEIAKGCREPPTTGGGRMNVMKIENDTNLSPTHIFFKSTI